MAGYADLEARSIQDWSRLHFSRSSSQHTKSLLLGQMTEIQAHLDTKSFSFIFKDDALP